MDDFREWLSDNLRYILLGLGILVVVVLLILGVRLVSSLVSRDDGQKKSAQKIEQQKEKEKEKKAEKQEEKPVKEPEDKEKPEDKENLEDRENPEEETKENHLEKTENPEVNELITNYYTALGNRDTQGLKKLVDQLNPAEVNSIENSYYIQGYSNVEVYTKKGLEEGSYVVYAEYDHKYVNYDTELPGVSCLYVKTASDGKLCIIAEPTQEQKTWMTEMTNEQDVQSFIAEKQAAYEEALKKDPKLETFLSDLGVGGSAALEAENGTAVTVKTNCNMREKATTESEKIGELSAGQKVTKTGQEGEWIKISTGELEGYVRADLFQ